jgi:hypothetical protein
MKKKSKKGKARENEFMVTEFLEYEPLRNQKYGDDNFDLDGYPFDNLKKAVFAARELADKSPHRKKSNYIILIYTRYSRIVQLGDDNGFYFFKRGPLSVLYKGRLKEVKNQKTTPKSLPVRFPKQNGFFEGRDGAIYKLLQLDNGHWTVEVFSEFGTKMGNHGSFSKKGDAIERKKYLCDCFGLNYDDFVKMPICFENTCCAEDAMDDLDFHLMKANWYLYSLGYEVSIKFSATPQESGSKMPVFEGDDLLKVIKGVEGYFEKIWSSKNRHPVKRRLPK